MDKQMNLPDHIGVDLFFAARAYEQAMFSRVRDGGFGDISVADSEILVAIPKDGARMVDVARSRRVTKQAAQERIKSLIARGYLEAVPDLKDRRARLLIHTERGAALRRALNKVKSELDADVEAELGREAMDTLRRHLHHLRGFLSG